MTLMTSSGYLETLLQSNRGYLTSLFFLSQAAEIHLRNQWNNPLTTYSYLLAVLLIG